MLMHRRAVPRKKRQKYLILVTTTYYKTTRNKTYTPTSNTYLCSLSTDLHNLSLFSFSLPALFFSPSIFYIHTYTAYAYIHMHLSITTLTTP
jgi:hypothetical protein